MADIKALANDLVNLTVKEVNDLVSLLKNEHGIEPAGTTTNAPVVVQPAVTENSSEAEKSSYSVILKSAGQQKIAVIKIVREATGLGLKEAKDLTDEGNKVIKENLSKADAENLKNRLETAGAEVELK